MSGRLTVAPRSGFVGTAKLRSRRPSAFATWLRGGPRAAGRLAAFSVQSRLEIAKDVAVFDDITATIGEDAVSGAVHLRSFPQSGDRFVNVQLAADRLDLDRGRSLIDVFAADWLSAGGATRVALDLKAATLIAGGVAAQNVVLDGVLADNTLALAELSVDDLAGARIAARGRITDPLGQASGKLDASLKADDLAGAVRFLTSLLPDNAAVLRLARVAPLLAPVEAELTVSTGTGEAPLSVGLTGTFAATRVSFNASGTGTLADPASLAGRADALVAGADTAAVLSQLGLDIVPLPDTGPARLTVAVEGALADGARLRINGEGAGVDLAVAGDAWLTGGQLSFAGDYALTGVDIDPALALAGVALPGIGAGHALSLSGPAWLDGRTLSLELAQATFDGDPVTGALEARLGENIAVSGSLGLPAVSMPVLLSAATGQSLEEAKDLSSERGFVAGIPSGLGLNLDIAASVLDLGLPRIARNADFRFTFGDGGVTIDGLRADFAGGKLRAAAAAVPQNGTMNFRLRAALDDARLEEIAWRAGDRAVAQGGLDLSFAVDGRGRAPAGIVSTLKGSGTFTVTNGLARSINPQAFGSIIRAADAGLKLDAEAVRKVFAGHLDAGTLAFERATGSFAVTSGIIRVSTLSLDSDSATVLGSATIDLNTLQLSSDWSMSVDPGEEKVTGAEPEVGLLFNGRLAAPARSIDVTPLVGFLTVRAFEKEVARIEALQAEILEKEFFQRQLKRQRMEAAAREREAQEAAAAAAEAAARAAEAAAEAAEAALHAGERPADAPKDDGIAGTTETPPGPTPPGADAAPAQQSGGESGANKLSGAAQAGGPDSARQRTGGQDATRSDSDALTDLIITDEPVAAEAGTRSGGLDAGADADAEAGPALSSGAEGLDADDAAVAPPPPLPPLPSITLEDTPIFDIGPNLPLVSRPSERLAPVRPEEEPEPVYKTLPNGVILRVN